MNQDPDPKDPQNAVEGPISSRDELLPFSPAAGCLLAIIIALAAGILIFQAGRLLYFGEIRLGGPELTPNRVWLTRESENAGLSFSRSTVVSGSLGGQQVCLRTQIWSLFWRRDDSQTISSYCLCYQLDNGRWNQVGDCQLGVDS